jgi:hypothetical protein
MPTHAREAIKMSDLVAFGGAGWVTIPVASPSENGTCQVSNFAVDSFPAWAATPGVEVVTGDFNGDGFTDLAALGVTGWVTIPMAFSNGNSTFRVTNFAVDSFPAQAATPGVKIVTGDFNGDGKTDLAVLGGAGWVTIPVAFSNGDGRFTPTNAVVDSFPAWAATPGVQIVTGDFNGDGKTDLAVLGGAGWGSIPVAFSNGDGTFTPTNAAVDSFPAQAATRGVHIVTGDFNGDGKTDLAVLGGAGWGSIPVAFSNGDGTFTPKNAAVDSFPAQAATPGVKIVTGYFNLDAKTDLAVLGGAGWGSIPIAFSNGDGTFRVTNAAVDSFPAWAATPGVKIVTGVFQIQIR